MKNNRNHAVVIGGSMGGLLAARVLSNHFQKVTLMERDAFPAVGEHRRGVPQGRHTHGLLASGLRVLEQHFPGLSADLIAQGAVSGDIVNEGRWFHEGGCLRQVASGLDGLLLSRPLLEGNVRERLRKIPNVHFEEGVDVQGLAWRDGRVVGIRCANRVIDADLVVDATGRGSKSPQWLEELGYARPQEDRVEVALGYATRMFRRNPEDLNGDVAAIIPPTPQGKRGGVMVAQEGDKWTVTLIAHFGNYAPADLAGFIEFSRTIPASFIYDVIRYAEPIGDGVTARFPASLRRRYERMTRFPVGYLVFGDAISSFNPIYGQGMSVSALESLELDSCLAEGDANLAARFFAKAARVVDIPWGIAVGNDLRMPETVGPRSFMVNFINWYMSKLHVAAHHDAELALAFHRVANLLAPPPSVLHPKMIWRVLRHSFSSREAAKTLRTQKSYIA